jgi:hypothetical protein
MASEAAQDTVEERAEYGGGFADHSTRHAPGAELDPTAGIRLPSAGYAPPPRQRLAGGYIPYLVAAAAGPSSINWPLIA